MKAECFIKKPIAQRSLRGVTKSIYRCWNNFSSYLSKNVYIFTLNILVILFPSAAENFEWVCIWCTSVDARTTIYSNETRYWKFWNMNCKDNMNDFSKDPNAYLRSHTFASTNNLFIQLKMIKILHSKVLEKIAKFCFDWKFLQIKVNKEAYFISEWCDRCL